MAVPANTKQQVVKIKGLVASQKADDITLAAITSEGTILGTQKFSIVSVTLTLNNSVPLKNDNAAKIVVSTQTFNRPKFSAAGPLVDNINVACWTPVEIIGKVTPADYRGEVILKRAIKGNKVFLGSIEITRAEKPAGPDTSDPSFRDDDPQSGGSKGVVYDTDAPGMNARAAVARTRLNFAESAVLDIKENPIPASEPLAWYSAISCTVGDGVVFDPTSQSRGDNQAKTGCIPLNANLSGSCN